MKRYFLFSVLLTAFCLCLPLHAATLFKAKTGQTIRITLESNPTTGYSWKMSSMAPRGIVKLMSSKYTSSQKDLAGAGGVEKWTFKAIKKGTVRVRFSYQRPWEKNIPPVENRDFKIEVSDEKTKK